jgi:predicted Zn-dependent peptidase
LQQKFFFKKKQKKKKKSILGKKKNPAATVNIPRVLEYSIIYIYIYYRITRKLDELHPWETKLNPTLVMHGNVSFHIYCLFTSLQTKQN